jgi:dienelactone hydrolase
MSTSHQAALRAGVLSALITAGCASNVSPALSSRNHDVGFASGTLELRGTLVVPGGEGRHPAVVLVHGSGPIDRDSAMTGQLGMGFGCSISVFTELAEALSDAGYVVLRYDKRSCGPFNRCADNGYPEPSPDLTVNAFVDDAAAAIEWLAAREEVDPQRIYLVGHSQGGSFAPRLLTDVATLRGAVLLAAPHRPIDQVMATQLASCRASRTRRPASASVTSLGSPRATSDATSTMRSSNRS